MKVLLSFVSCAFAALGKPVHATLFPFPWANTVHAARISVAYQVNARRAGARPNWPTYIVGYLIMCWGGTLLTHHLLGLAPPMLYSFAPYVNYTCVHLCLTALFAVFPWALDARALDLALWPLDGLVRTGAVLGGLAHLSASGAGAEAAKLSGTGVDARLSGSPLTVLVVGALASSGGGLLASTFSTWSGAWSFSTPPVLRAPGVWASMDVWAGALFAGVHAVLTRHAAFEAVVVWMEARVLPGFGWDGREMRMAESDARALVGTLFALLFGARAYATHCKQRKETTEKKTQ